MIRLTAVHDARPYVECNVRPSILLLLLLATGLSADEWPLHFAENTIEVLKSDGLEPEDPHWFHLHQHHATAADSDAVTMRANVFRGSRSSDERIAAPNIEIRYTVHGVPVSNWQSPAAPFTLRVDNPALDVLADGFHDVSVEVRGADRMRYKPLRAFLHLTRGRPVSTLVPVIAGVTGYNGDGDFGPAVVYVDSRHRRLTGVPANPRVTPWSAPPYAADLYLEQLAPGGDYVAGAQLWWEDPPHPGVPFVRALDPNQSQDHRGLRIAAKHEKLPFRDGPRGVGWMSPYVSGQVDSRGGFAFVETGGPARYLRPDGEIVTVAGWRVRPGRDPVWSSKPLATVRSVMEKRGQWTEGRGEFFTPLDLAIDPKNENVWYVTGYEDHCVWKIEIEDLAANRVRVSVFAGDPNHAPGFADGAGHAARFRGPASLVFDPVSDSLYVADQDNDAIRRISRAGVVTTVIGAPGAAARLRARGAADVFDHNANRALGDEIYMPQCIRVDSRGNLILLELGYGWIRRIDPATRAWKHLGDVHQNFEEEYRGWAWLDVDRWGNSGPKDGIYWCKSVGDEIDGDAGAHFNEVYAWLPPEGGKSRYVFGEHWNPYPAGWGARDETNAPHYPWLVAVDPRGAVLVGGFGMHGVSRLRARRADDPVPSRYHPDGHEDGRFVWASGAPWSWPRPSGSYASRPASLKFGWNAHNYLGFADAWSLRGDETDEQLLNYFEAPAPVRQDPRARALWLDFIRVNRGAPDPDCPGPSLSGDGEWFAGESGDTSAPLLSRPTAPGRYWKRVMNRCGVALGPTVTMTAATPKRRTSRH